MLILQGDADLQVLASDLPRLVDAARLHDGDVTVRIFPNDTHLFMTLPPGEARTLQAEVEGYVSVAQYIDPSVLEAMIQWLKRRAASPAALKASPCRIGQTRAAAICGTLTVFEDRAARRGRTIGIHFVVIEAKHRTQRAIVFNPGGPGASATAAAADFADATTGAFATLRDRYDILLVDNRGTGGSAPQDCDFAPAEQPELYFRQVWPDTIVRSCRDRLAAHAQLTPALSKQYPEAVLEGLASDLQELGGLHAIVFKGETMSPKTRVYKYLLRFGQGNVMATFTLDSSSRIAGLDLSG
jgi:hypothetical protein